MIFLNRFKFKSHSSLVDSKKTSGRMQFADPNVTLKIIRSVVSMGYFCGSVEIKGCVLENPENTESERSTE